MNEVLFKKTSFMFPFNGPKKELSSFLWVQVALDLVEVHLSTGQLPASRPVAEQKYFVNGIHFCRG